MLLTSAIGMLCTLLLSVDASSRKTKELVFYDEDKPKGRTSTVVAPKSAQRFKWLMDSFHNTLFESMAVKAEFLRGQLGTSSTEDNFNQVWQGYLEATNGAFQKRLTILEEELRKAFIRGYGVPVDTEVQALKFFQREITRKTEEAEDEVEDEEANKKKIRKEKERELKRKEKEIQEVKREKEKVHKRQDLKRMEQRGFTPVKVSKRRKRSSDSSD